MKLHERRRESGRRGAQLVQDARIRGKPHLRAGKPHAPAEIGLLQVREEVRIEGADVVDHTPANEQRGSLRCEDLIRRREPLFRLVRAAVDEEACGGQERAGRVQQLGVVHQQELRLARTPRRAPAERADECAQRSRLELRVVVQQED